MGFAIAILIIVVLFVVVMAIRLAGEQYDKDTRVQNGLPPKKYHDITDQDVTTVYTIRRK